MTGRTANRATEDFAFKSRQVDPSAQESKLNAFPSTLITSPAPSTYLWPGCGVTRAEGIAGEPWVITVDEEFCLEPDRARDLAAQLLAAADLAEALRAANT